MPFTGRRLCCTKAGNANGALTHDIWLRRTYYRIHEKPISSSKREQDNSWSLAIKHIRDSRITRQNENHRRNKTEESTRSRWTNHRTIVDDNIIFCCAAAFRSLYIFYFVFGRITVSHWLIQLVSHISRAVFIAASAIRNAWSKCFVRNVCSVRIHILNYITSIWLWLNFEFGIMNAVNTRSRAAFHITWAPRVASNIDTKC